MADETPHAIRETLSVKIPKLLLASHQTQILSPEIPDEPKIPVNKHVTDPNPHPGKSPQCVP